MGCIITLYYYYGIIIIIIIVRMDNYYHFDRLVDLTTGVIPFWKRFFVLLKLTMLKMILWSFWTFSTLKLNQNRMRGLPVSGLMNKSYSFSVIKSTRPKLPEPGRREGMRERERLEQFVVSWTSVWYPELVFLTVVFSNSADLAVVIPNSNVIRCLHYSTTSWKSYQIFSSLYFWEECIIWPDL